MGVAGWWKSFNNFFFYQNVLKITKKGALKVDSMKQKEKIIDRLKVLMR